LRYTGIFRPPAVVLPTVSAIAAAWPVVRSNHVATRKNKRAHGREAESVNQNMAIFHVNLAFPTRDATFNEWLQQRRQQE
jgi:hypothetical protein